MRNPGHADRSGTDAYNLSLSDARARSVLAVLVDKRDRFVSVCAEFNVPEDNPVILRFAAREYGWPCEPAQSSQATPGEIKSFQRSFNDHFGGSLTVDGVVGNQTRGAYFDLYQDALARSAGSAAALDRLRVQLRFVSDGRKYIACGERFPVENPEQDGYRSKRNRRVELLFFAPPDLPELDGADPAKLIYNRRKYTITRLDRDALASAGAVSSGEPFTPPPFQLACAEPPQPGVGEPEEVLETTMAMAGEQDPADQYAFLDPFDRTFPDVGHQASRETDTVIV